LLLGWYLRVTSAARVTLYFYDGKTVPGVLTDTLESGKKTLVYFLLQFACTQHQGFRLGFRLG
jgi:hypothetical protein